MIFPIGIPGGKIEPEVAGREPGGHHHLALGDLAAALEVVELEVVRVADVRARPPRSRRSAVTRAVTALSASVISVTWAVFGVVWVIFPASPCAATTGSSTRTPSLDPLSIVTVEYQTVGERPITRAVTGSVPSGTMPPLVSSFSAESSLASCCCVCARAS